MSLVTRLFAQPDPPHCLIARNPRLELMISNRAVFLAIAIFFFIFYILLSIVLIVIDGLVISKSSLFSLMFLFMSLFQLVNASFYSVQLHYWKRIEPWRFIATLGDDHLLADEQPQSDSDALQIPATVRMSSVVERRFFLGYFSLSLLLTMIFIYCCLTILLPFSVLGFWLLPIAIFFGALLLFVFALVARLRRPVEVNQEGIRFRIAQGFAFLPWHEARLFACYPEPGPWSDSPAIVYELSSASHVFHWTCLRPESRLSILRRLFYPFEKDDVQMQALCSLVAVKTGLPLYDLGKAKVEQ